jgi:FkbM family methyltransferase
VQLKGVPRLLWRYRRFFQRPDATYRTHGGLLLRIDNGVLFQWWNVINYAGYELVLLLERFLGPGDVYVDVGANLGFIALSAARVVGDDGLVLAVEPEPRVREKLTVNLALNRAASVRVVPEAVSDAAGSATFRVATEEGLSRLENDRRSGFGMILLDTLTVPVTTLPALTQRHAPGRTVTLVKIDVEGHELRILQAAGALLGPGQTSFILEINSGALAQNDASFTRIFDLFRAHGYAVYWISSHSADWFRWGRFPSLTRVDDPRSYEGRSADVLAIPPAHEDRLRASSSSIGTTSGIRMDFGD